VSEKGESDERFIDFERLLRSEGKLWEVRAFLYNVVHIKDLYVGDGYTYTPGGLRTTREFFAHNMLLSELGEYRLIDIPYHNSLAAADGGN